MPETAWIPVLLGLGGLIFWAGVMFARVDSLREWRDAQQKDAAELKVAQARLAEGHMSVVQTVAFIEGMLDRRGPGCGAAGGASDTPAPKSLGCGPSRGGV